VIPSSNAIMSANLMWLGLIMGEPNWLEMHKRMQAIMRPMMLKNPAWYSRWLQNDWLRLSGAWQIVISGPDCTQIAKTLRKVLIDYPIIEADKSLHLPLCQGKFNSMVNRIYVCEWQMCHSPLQNMDEAIEFVAAAIHRG
jgi:uncharacterized protein YyaL (SSP411 family)